jgi:hypothetical protein
MTAAFDEALSRSELKDRKDKVTETRCPKHHLLAEMVVSDVPRAPEVSRLRHSDHQEPLRQAAIYSTEKQLSRVDWTADPISACDMAAAPTEALAADRFRSCRDPQRKPRRFHRAITAPSRPSYSPIGAHRDRATLAPKAADVRGRLGSLRLILIRINAAGWAAPGPNPVPAADLGDPHALRRPSAPAWRDQPRHHQRLMGGLSAGAAPVGRRRGAAGLHRAVVAALAGLGAPPMDRVRGRVLDRSRVADQAVARSR